MGIQPPQSPIGGWGALIQRGGVMPGIIKLEPVTVDTLFSHASLQASPLPLGILDFY